MRSLVVLSLAAVLTAGLPAVTAQAKDPAGLQIVSLDKSEITGKQFAMVALRGTEKLPENVDIQVRRVNGGWGPWQPLETDDAIDNKTEPLWVGDSTGIRVRGAEKPGLSLALINPGAQQTNRGMAVQAIGTPGILGRAAWGADESIREACFARQGIGIEYSSTLKAAAIHHTAGTNDYAPADSARIVRGVYMFHAIDRDWCDIGYNFLVDKYGQIFEGRIGGIHYPVWGAHAGGFNQFTFSVSMMGTYSTVAPANVQLDSVAAVVAWKLSKSYRDPNSTVTLISAGGETSKYPAGVAVNLPIIFAHRDVGKTDCPGQAAYNMLPTLRQKVAQMGSDWHASQIRYRWLAFGGENGPLGGVYRVEDPSGRGGWYTVFMNGLGALYWSPMFGVKRIQGLIMKKWVTEYGAENGRYGFPATDEAQALDGAGWFNDFEKENGSIFWGPATGTHAIQGLIKQKWYQIGRETGKFGYPTTDELVTHDGQGRYNDFQKDNGSIYWHPATGTYSVQGLIKAHWLQVGGGASYLGYPKSDEYSTTGGLRSDFQGGYVFYDYATGQTTDHRYA